MRPQIRQVDTQSTESSRMLGTFEGSMKIDGTKTGSQTCEAELSEMVAINTAFHILKAMSSGLYISARIEFPPLPSEPYRPCCRCGDRRGSHASYCPECWVKYIRAYEKRPAERIKARARKLAHSAILSGKLVPLPCEVCGDELPESHHEDYAKPLEIRWLCKPHHQLVTNGDFLPDSEDRRMSKAHLVIRETPLADGSRVETLCETELSPAQIVLMWDSVAMNSPLAFSTLLCCKKCWDSLPLVYQGDAAEARRYIYGVVRQQEGSDATAQA